MFFRRTRPKATPMKSQKRMRPVRAARREEALGSTAAFLVSFVICYVGLGFGAFFYGLIALNIT